MFTENRHPENLLLEHVGAPQAAAPPCAGAASAASPPRVGAAAPPRARQAGAAAPPRVRRAGAAAPTPSPASLMARLTPCTCLRKEKLLDSLLGDQRRWCWSFLGAAVDEVLGQTGFILTRRRTVRRSVTCLGTRVLADKIRIPLRSASVRTHTIFTTGFPRFLSICRVRGLQAFDLPLHTSYSNPNYDQTRKQLNYTREND
jgi:hypothetical protein